MLITQVTFCIQVKHYTLFSHDGHIRQSIAHTFPIIIGNCYKSGKEPGDFCNVKAY